MSQATEVPAVPPSFDAWPPPPPVATACPRCGVVSSCQSQVQSCPSCQTRFLLVAGPLMDKGCEVPEPGPATKELRLKAPGLFVVMVALLRPEAIGYGALDPVLGRFPMDEKGLRFGHIYSLAAWRAVNVPQAVMFFVLSLPLALLSLLPLFATGAAPALLLALPFCALAAFHAWRVFKVKSTRTRIVGVKGRVLDMTFAGTLGARQRFHDELLRRCGLSPTQLP